VTDPFLAEIRIFGGNFAPTGWAQCNGQLMAISQNTALFSLLGTTYGGDGRVTFALPDLRGGTPLQQGQGPGLSYRTLGEMGGEPAVTLISQEMAMHTHLAGAVSRNGDLTAPGNGVWGQAAYGRQADAIYAVGQTPNTQMNAATSPMVGGGQPHNNMPPYLGVNFIIALQGIFPQRP
jgi:microcystin-dependent protein